MNLSIYEYNSNHTPPQKRRLVYGVMVAALCCVLGFAGGSHTAWAQELQPYAPPTEQQLADPTTLLQAGTKVVGLIDQGLASQLWAHVSPVAQSVLEEQQFTNQIYTLRRPLGAVLQRHWVAITQLDHPGSAGLPSGLYVTVTFITSFAGRSNVQEQVTFRQDEDNVWRITGYVIR